MQAQEVDAVVVGAGIAGLTAAYELALAGLKPVVIEARGYTGGVLAGKVIDGMTCDIGAESFACRDSDVVNFVESLGLHTEHPAAGGSFIYRKDHLYPIPRRSILGIPQDLDDPDVISEIGVAHAKKAVEQDSQPIGDLPQDLAGVIKQRYGTHVLEAFVAPVAGGIHSADPSTLSVDVVVPGLRQAIRSTGSLRQAVRDLRDRQSSPSPIATVTGGMHMLAQTLADTIRSHGGTVLTRVGTQHLIRDRNRWLIPAAETTPAPKPSQVPVPQGTPHPLVTSRVVLATPVREALTIIGEHVDVSGFSLMPGSPIAHMTLSIESHDLDAVSCGTGVLVTADTRSTSVKALTRMSAKWGWVAKKMPAHHHLLRVSYGRSGEHYPHPTQEGTIDDINHLLDLTLSVRDVRAHQLIRWDGALTPPTPASRQLLSEIVEQVSTLEGFSVIGGWVAGSGISAIIPHARTTARDLV